MFFFSCLVFCYLFFKKKIGGWDEGERNKKKCQKLKERLTQQTEEDIKTRVEED